MPPTMIAPLPGADSIRHERNGTSAAIVAHTLWGGFAAFFGMLAFASPAEILAQRIIWTAVSMVVVLTFTHGLTSLRRLSRRAWCYSAAASFAVSINWGIYVYGVISGQVVECALGYFIGPLVNVLMGVAIFGERLTRGQFFAVAIASSAVVVLTTAYGKLPWLALSLAVTFAAYGALKKVSPTDPIRGMAAEGLVGAPFAVLFLLLTPIGLVGFGDSVSHTALLVLAGPVTIVPLLLYGFAAQQISMIRLGIIQYLTPALQMAWGVIAIGEDMPPSRWIGFTLIWCALTVFTVDSLSRARRRRSVVDSVHR